MSKWKFSVWQICPSDNFTHKCLFYNNLSTQNSYFRPQLHCPSGNFQFDKLVQVTTSLKNAYFTTICPLKIPILDQLQCKFARKFQNFQKFVFFCLTNICHSLTNLSRWCFSARQKTNICQSGNFQFDKFVRAIISLKNAQVEISTLTNLSRWHFPARQKTNVCQSGNFQFDKFVQAIILLKNTCFTTICPLEIPILDQLHCQSGNFQFDKFV